MKTYLRNSLFVAIFAAIAFFAVAVQANALSISFGFGSQSSYSQGYSSGYNNYGYGNSYGYSAPINCFNSGYPCNGYFGGNSASYGYGNSCGYNCNNYNNYNTGCGNYCNNNYNYGNNYDYNYGSYGYQNGCGYNCSGRGTNSYTMSSPTYLNSTSYYDYSPVRTNGFYSSNNMYSIWNGY